MANPKFVTDDKDPTTVSPETAAEREARLKQDGLDKANPSAERARQAMIRKQFSGGDKSKG